MLRDASQRSRGVDGCVLLRAAMLLSMRAREGVAFGQTKPRSECAAMARAAATNCATLPSQIKAQRKECSRAISPPLLLRAEPAAPRRAGGGADELHGAGRIHEPVLR